MKHLIKTLMFMLLVGLLIGCGTSDDGDNADRVVPSLVEVDDKTYDYKVKNQTDQTITLEFNSSQRFDYAIFNDEDEQVYLHSDEMMYSQVIGEEELEAGEELVYRIDLSEIDLDPGEYVLEAWMVPNGEEKYKVSENFIIE
ncbi:hypothetical protein GCM10011351_19950 [Paraliobacillus quinghaiensis]|uniref:Intracellular proteinase inhibitor BsuPI domain-containing protein n=1 Tax=Paraliobacillus quinghaiensis TaxID=470815 RepID=A0A917WVQ6_9BACI|nr:BsuPI-related putative proteinase inhibitor [Paraliobacillus quinghaiensis]GGM33975.1 hypothetical protein GCM10011351_19950 [Paraliobacillus quinghaiensis]